MMMTYSESKKVKVLLYHLQDSGIWNAMQLHHKETIRNAIKYAAQRDDGINTSRFAIAARLRHMVWTDHSLELFAEVAADLVQLHDGLSYAEDTRLAQLGGTLLVRNPDEDEETKFAHYVRIGPRLINSRIFVYGRYIRVVRIIHTGIYAAVHDQTRKVAHFKDFEELRGTLHKFHHNIDALFDVKTWTYKRTFNVRVAPAEEQ